MTTTAPLYAHVRAEAVPQDPDFRALHSLHGVAYELRYASTNNFAQRNLYGALDCAWLRTPAALGLEAAARWLAAQGAPWQLLVLDALRPQRVQEAIWQGVLGTPQQSYFADPARGSIHSWGLAVDVTLVRATPPPGPGWLEADMGSTFDEMSEKSHPELHAQLLANGQLQPRHVQQRDMLRQAMAQGGFAGIANEWWHFDHGDKAHARLHLPRVY